MFRLDFYKIQISQFQAYFELKPLERDILYFEIEKSHKKYNAQWRTWRKVPRGRGGPRITTGNGAIFAGAPQKSPSKP